MKRSCVRLSHTVLIFVALTLVGFTTSHAQTARVAAEPFVAGEMLVYEAKYNRLLLRGIEAADVTFQIVAPQPNAAANTIQIKTEAVSKGSLLSLFRFKFIQRLDSTIDAQNFRVLQTISHDEQGDRIRDSTANFNYTTNQVTYREVNPNNMAEPPRTITSPITPTTQDIVTAFYYLRRQQLAVGKEFTLSVSNAGVVYRIPVRVVEREQIDSLFGKVWTYRVEPEVFGERRLIRGEGKMIIWMTDDARHLPVRAQINHPIGKIIVTLRRAENLSQAAAVSNRQ